MNLLDCYTFLGLHPGESIEKVYRAYREILAECHPRKYYSSPKQLAAACERWYTFHEAYYNIALTVTQEVMGNVAAQSVPDIQNASSLVEGAIRFRELGRFSDSLAEFANAIRCDPSNAVAYVELAQLFGTMQLPAQAIKAISCALQINPKHYLALFIMAQEHMSLGTILSVCRREREAIAYFEKAIEWHKINIQHNGPDAIIYTDLGEAYEAVERFDDAICAYNEAILLYEQVAALNPDDPEVHRDLGCACLSAQRYRDAISAFQDLISLDGDGSANWWFLGVAHNYLKEFRHAIQAFKEAIRLKPDDVMAHLYLGRAQLKINNKLEALEEYKILRGLDSAQADKLFTEIYP